MPLKAYYSQVCFILQGDIEKGLEMKRLVLSGFLASEEIYINQLEALLLVRHSDKDRQEAETMYQGSYNRVNIGVLLLL